MEKIFVHVTELENQTNQVVEFHVENMHFHLRALPPGKKRLVKLWKVVRACRKNDCPKWKIRFLINKEFTGIEINANQLLCYARIIIKLERIGEGLYLPYLEALLEKPIDYWLRLKYLGFMRDEYWDKRSCFQIRPDKKWAKDWRVVEAQAPPQLVVAIANKSLLRSQSCRTSIKNLPKEEENDEKKIKANSSPEGPRPAVPEPTASLSLPKRQMMIDAGASSGRKHEEKKVTLSINADDKRIVSPLPAAAPKRKRNRRIRRKPGSGDSVGQEVERGSGLELQKEDDDQRSQVKYKDMQKTVYLMLLVMSFVCVCFLNF